MTSGPKGVDWRAANGQRTRRIKQEKARDGINLDSCAWASRLCAVILAAGRESSTRGMSIQPAVYILASQRNSTLYVGVTGALRERFCQHREAMIASFTAQYGVKTLVHFEVFAPMPEAFGREKELKQMLRKAKRASIERGNPNWRDLRLVIQ